MNHDFKVLNTNGFKAYFLGQNWNVWEIFRQNWNESKIFIFCNVLNKIIAYLQGFDIKIDFKIILFGAKFKCMGIFLGKILIIRKWLFLSLWLKKIFWSLLFGSKWELIINFYFLLFLIKSLHTFKALIKKMNFKAYFMGPNGS